MEFIENCWGLIVLIKKEVYLYLSLVFGFASWREHVIYRIMPSFWLSGSWMLVYGCENVWYIRTHILNRSVGISVDVVPT